ncbi:ABC transporter membrane component [Leifsonia xyli subsp. cynodontis DSM 46306]|uniref:SUF system FeS cluster assembly SufBD core domain-containing protein n=1 Tax=Leifsonia xyli subsp. cynodontis DSM 46306 TaxID=1389489 RepID=U3P6E3_LEIXC|nr:Fe-S cluster assembly protein SufD [Leifsonia xyli]AGW41356.1 ABC transporter membrane component [Leifsonia xyli subsp. cynodontis DSM 46306]
MTSASTPTQTTAPAPPAHLRAPVPVQTRSERFTSTEVADFPEVTGREVMWKHTPVARLTELLAGELDGAPYLYDVTTAPRVTTAWIGRDDARIGAAGAPEDRASATAWTGFERALLVSIAGDDAKEVTLTRSALGGAARAAHTVVEVADGARATLILQNSGPAHLSENVEFLVGKDADLTVVSVQEWDADALHLAAHFAELAEGGRLKHVAVTLGGSVVRLNPSAHLAGARSEAELLGAYFADASQHLEQQVYVHHDGAETRSRVTYKGALQGEGARTVWIGDVLIGPKAVGTDTYEQNRNLVLTDGARADSIPNLEIETGDIVGAGHASATGRFDDEQLFYLQSRGIPEEEARRLVVRGFLFEIVQQIGSPALQERLQTAIEAELALSVTAAS